MFIGNDVAGIVSHTPVLRAQSPLRDALPAATWGDSYYVRCGYRSNTVRTLALQDQRFSRNHTQRNPGAVNAHVHRMVSSRLRWLPGSQRMVRTFARRRSAGTVGSRDDAAAFSNRTQSLKLYGVGALVGLLIGAGFLMVNPDVEQPPLPAHEVITSGSVQPMR